MTKFLILAAMALAACNSPRQVQLAQALCAADALAQPLIVPLAAAVTTAVAPGQTGNVVLATQLDAQAHAAVQAACAGVGKQAAGAMAQ